MKTIEALFEKFLRARDLRLTRQRQAILHAIYGTHRHVSADELYDLIHRDESQRELGISRATVYRTLALLCEGGFVQALDIGRDSGTLYEHVLGHVHHDHMVCLQCGRITEFADDALEAAQDRAIAAHGFRASSHRLNVFGTCAACQAKEGLQAGAAGEPASAPPGGRDAPAGGS